MTTPVPQGTQGRRGGALDRALLIPAVDAVVPVRQLTPLDLWRAVWTARHTAVAAVLTPLLFWVNSLQILTRPLTVGWVVGLLAVSVVGALTLATYLPTRTREGGLRANTPCAAGAGVFVVLAWLGLGLSGPSPWGTVLPLLLTVMGLSQRLMGAAICR